MVIFFSIVVYLAFVALTVWGIIQIRKLSQTLKEQTEAINALDKKLYTDLRMVQYRAMDITKQANKFVNSKNSILGEIVSAVALAILPFKKLKSLIYLHKLGKKVIR